MPHTAGMGDLGVSIFRLASLQSFFALTRTQLLILKKSSKTFLLLIHGLKELQSCAL